MKWLRSSKQAPKRRKWLRPNLRDKTNPMTWRAPFLGDDYSYSTWGSPYKGTSEDKYDSGAGDKISMDPEKNIYST